MELQLWDVRVGKEMVSVGPKPDKLLDPSGQGKNTGQGFGLTWAFGEPQWLLGYLTPRLWP